MRQKGFGKNTIFINSLITSSVTTNLSILLIVFNKSLMLKLAQFVADNPDNTTRSNPMIQSDRHAILLL